MKPRGCSSDAHFCALVLYYVLARLAYDLAHLYGYVQTLLTLMYAW